MQSKRICSQEHDPNRLESYTKMATAIFLCTTLRAKWNRTVGCNGYRAKKNQDFSTNVIKGVRRSLSLSASLCHCSG